MRSLIKIVAAIVLVLWSLFAWAVHALLGAAAGFAVANTWLIPVPPEWVYWAAAVLDGASGVGSVLVWIVWALGAAMILIVAAIALKLAGRSAPPATYAGPGATYPDTSYPPPAEREFLSRPAKASGSPSVEDIVSRVSGKPRR